MAGEPGVLLREVAEYPNSFVELGPGDERIDEGRYTLCISLGATVQRQRFAVEELDEVLAEVRGLVRERGLAEAQWEVGSGARELVEPLLARGLTRDEDPVAVALVLRREPPAPPAGLPARRLATLDEHLAAVAVQSEAFGAPPEDAARHRAWIRSRWDQPPYLMHGVWADGELVAVGTSAPTQAGLVLFGGATLPRARGRGAYRALIAERWREACALPDIEPALLTQAGSMSRPILERLGFEAVGRVEMLRDRFGGG